MAIETYEGEYVQGEGVVDLKPLRTGGTSKFRFMVHPEQWEWVAPYGWLPHIKRFSRQPGVNGVKHDNKGGDTLAVAQKMEEGFQFIDYQQTQDGKSYMMANSNTTSGKPLHHDRWYSFKQIGNRVFPKRDREGYNEWRKWLVTEGIIDAPDPDVLRAILGTKYDNITRTQALQHLPELKAKRTANKKKLEAAEAAIG